MRTMAGEISGAPRGARRRRTGVLAALTATALAAGLLVAAGGPAQAAKDPVTMPAHPKGLTSAKKLPAELDVVPGYVPQVACWPTEKPGVAKLRRLVLRTYGVGSSGGSTRACQTGESEHLEGRAWDWMLDPGKKAHRKAAGDFLAWLTRDGGANARRLGVMYVIYNKKIWASYNAGEGWRPSWGHEDHIHVSLSWDGAYARTSFWRGRALTVQDLGPCTYFRGTYAALRSTRRFGDCEVTSAKPVKTSKLQKRSFGTSGKVVRKGQRLLKVPQTSRFDTRTWKAVRSYQKRHDLPVTGVLDTATWASLSPKDVRSDVTRGLSRAAAGKQAKAQYSLRVLRVGRSIGRDVIMLQTALGMPRAQRNGYYGSRTKAAVKAFQKRRGLPVTGVTDERTWKALPG